jgi:UDP-N-acetylenolpyruvoylglucosamine reductase
LNDKQQLAELMALIKQYPKYFVLGGGSNLILPQFYDGLVIHNQLYGKTCHDDGDEEESNKENEILEQRKKGRNKATKKESL